MPDPITVSNTSPLYYLHQLRQLPLLHQLYGRLLVPAAVQTELERGEKGGYSVPDLAQFPWLEVVEVHPDRFPSHGLGDGEWHALALAFQRRPDSLVILDERAARQLAHTLGLPVVGTVGVLVQAKRQGHLERVAPCLEALVQARFRLHPSVAAKALQLAGEASP